MACGIQKLFSVEAEFEDEDFALAVEDVKKQVSGPVPVSSRFLRPPSSALSYPSTPSNVVVPEQGSSTLVPSDSLSPVLQIQNYSRLRYLQDSSPSKFKSSKGTSLPGDGIMVQKDQATLLAQSRPCFSSESQFKFVKRHLATPSTECAHHNEYIDNELFLAACMELEESETLSPGPSVSDCERIAKKMRVADSAKLSNTVGAETSPLQRPLKETPGRVSGHLRAAEASPKMTLRPTAMGSHSSHSKSGMSTGLGTISSQRCELPRLFHASLDKPVAGHNSSCLPLVRTSSPSGIAALSPLTPQIPSQSFPSPKMVNQSAPLLTAYGPLMASVASSPAAPRTVCSTTTSGSLQTPVVTNHLVRLVTAANKPPQPSACVSLQAKTRRFPGPAGILSHQPDGRNLEEIMVSIRQTPTHGASAKLQKEEVPASQQPAEEECGRGPWVAMKTELGLDEQDPSCFLRTYSVVMVLRKAALKQLPKNKVPNMAVMIKSLTRTTVDAGAVFKDPTGEMQGTIHRLLLEQRESDLKAGSVLLLKQVGVFSPSNRNHYLNVTPNNLVKIYLPGLSGRTPPQLYQEIMERGEMPLLQALSGFQQDLPTDAPATDATTDCEKGGDHCRDPPASQVEAGGMGRLVLNASSPKADSDDLDQLLGELPDDFFSNSDIPRVC